MKHFFWALGVSLTFHVLLLIYAPLPKLTPPSIVGVRRSVTISLADDSDRTKRKSGQTKAEAATTAVKPEAPTPKTHAKTTAPEPRPIQRQQPDETEKNKIDASTATRERSKRTSPLNSKAVKPPASRRRKTSSQPAALPTPKSQSPSEIATADSKAPADSKPVGERSERTQDKAGNNENEPIEKKAGHPYSKTAGATERSSITRAVPLYRQNPSPAYPRLARSRGYEGKVLIDVLVGTDGHVIELKISKSSGHGVLDRAAAKAVRKWRFEPGRSGQKAVAMWVQVPVRFELE